MKRLLFSILSIFILNVSGQDVHQLNLDQSIEIAMEKSFRMQEILKNLEISEYNLQAATRRFRTKMNLDFRGPEYTQTIGEYEDSAGLHFFQTNKLYYQGVLTINQNLPTDGNIFISSGLYNTNDYRFDENSLKLGTSINFTQPILALYSYNRIKSEFQRAKLNYENAEIRQKREELNLIYDVSQMFYNLLNAQQRMDIALQALKRQQEAFEIAQNKYAAGLIREVEALQIEVDLGQSQNEHDLSIANYEFRSDLFKQNLGLPLNDSVVLENDMDYKIVYIDESKAIEHGLTNRIEIREMEIEIELNEINLKRQRSEGLVSGEVTAHYGFAGVDKNSLPVSFYSSFSDSYNTLLNSPDDYRIGLNIHIPIIDWGENKSRVKAIRASQEINLLRLNEDKVTIEREIRNTISQLQSALRRLQLNEKNVSLAEKSFEISQYRFKNGDIDSEALALDRNRLNNAHLSYLESYISYKLNIADLMRKTFYDFEKDQPVN